MTTLEQILDNYSKLCAYCDSFFSSMRQIYGQDMKCAKGCSACCELTSVSMLEAYVISRNIISGNEPKNEAKAGAGIGDFGVCIMLKNNECCIYQYRPLICRTHGCVIAMDEQKNKRATCILNFIGNNLKTFPNQHVFDSSRITDNLMRLNLAFCIEQGTKELSAERISLSDLL